MTTTSSIETIDRDNPTPMYRQIRQDLESQMLSGKLPLGAQVPTEQLLCEQYGVSRITARRALEDLRKSGIIERIPGRGSFVRELPAGAMEEATEIAVLTSFTPHSLLATADDSWNLQIIRSLDSCLLEEGFHASSVPPYDGEKWKSERFWERIDTLGPRLGGVFAFASPVFPSILNVLNELDRRGIPWVTVNSVSRQQTYNFVAADNFEGSRKMAVEFLRLGYQKALFISTALEHSSNSNRFLGFLQGWVEGGRRLPEVDNMKVAASETMSDAEMERLAQRLAGKDRPRVIFCGGDFLASITLKLCQQLGLAVPDEVAVVGGTGMALAEHTFPTLTVLAQPMNEIGRVAGEMLIKMIRTKQQRMPGRYVACPLIRRESCPVGMHQGALTN